MTLPLRHPRTGLLLTPLGWRRDGRAIWPILGGNGEGEGSGDGEQGSGQGAEARFTQDDLTRIATQNKNEGARHGQRELAKSLGFTKPDGTGDVDAMKAAAQAHLDNQRQAETDAERKIREAEQREQAADARERAAAQREHDANVRAALVSKGVTDPKLIANAAKLIEVETGADEAAIAQAVETLKTDVPALFTAAGTPPHSDPGRGPHRSPGNGTRDPGANGRAAAEARGWRRPANA